MKNLLKNNNNNVADDLSKSTSIENKKPMGKNRPRFLQKFAKKTDANASKPTANLTDGQQADTAFSANTQQTANPATIAQVQSNHPNYYSPPSSQHVTNQRYEHVDYAPGTWYSINGRIGRVQLLAYGFILFLAMVLVYAIAAVVISLFGPGASSLVFAIATIPLVPLFIYSYFILPRRRLHDIAKSGWWTLLEFIPIANLLLWIYLYFMRGDEGTNEYGYPPAPYTQVEFWLAVMWPILFAVVVLTAIFAPSMYMDEILDEEMTIEEAIVSQNTEPKVTLEPVATEGEGDTANEVGQNKGNEVIEETTLTDETPSADNKDNKAVQTNNNQTTINPNAASADLNADETQPVMIDDGSELSSAAAQAQAAIRKATQSEDEQTAKEPTISYDDFLQEAETTIYREPIKKTTTKAPSVE